MRGKTFEEVISIHAPYAGSDRLLTKFNLRGLGFCFFLYKRQEKWYNRSRKRGIARKEQLEPVTLYMLSATAVASLYRDDR